MPCDVGERTQVDEAVRRAAEGLGPVQILVNNAGIAVSAKLVDTDDALWERHLRVNLTGAFLHDPRGLPGMLAAALGPHHQHRVDRGASGVPARRRLRGLEARLLGLTRALAQEVVAAGVTVNAICPGYVATE